MGDSDQWDEAEAARDAQIDKAERASARAVKRQASADTRYTWDEWQKFNAGLDPEPDESELFVGEIGFLKPDLFLFADYQAMDESEEPDAIYINLNQVTRVDTFGSFKISLTDGSSVQTNDTATIERFMEQWQLS